MLDTHYDSASRLLTVKASGEVSHTDYHDTFIPAVEAAVKSSGKISLLYDFGPEFEGFTAHAMWDDMRLGMAHLKDFERIAVVARNAALRGAVRAFAVMMPAQVRTFDIGEADAAKQWAGGH